MVLIVVLIITMLVGLLFSTNMEDDEGDMISFIIFILTIFLVMNMLFDTSIVTIK